jgi:hypothetical protein
MTKRRLPDVRVAVRDALFAAAVAFIHDVHNPERLERAQFEMGASLLEGQTYDKVALEAVCASLARELVEAYH